MLGKWLEYFYKYGHIYEFPEKEEKPEEEIKRYLVKELGIPESTARYQMQVALRKEVEMDKKALLNVKEMCEYLGIGQTKARELLSDSKNKFTIRIGNRLYAYKGRLNTWLINIPNDTLKWLKNSRLYGNMDGIFDVSLSKLQPGKEAQMGKSLHGKELGKGISHSRR